MPGTSECGLLVWPELGGSVLARKAAAVSLGEEESVENDDEEEGDGVKVWLPLAAGT